MHTSPYQGYCISHINLPAFHNNFSSVSLLHETQRSSHLSAACNQIAAGHNCSCSQPTSETAPGTQSHMQHSLTTTHFPTNSLCPCAGLLKQTTPVCRMFQLTHSACKQTSASWQSTPYSLGHQLLGDLLMPDARQPKSPESQRMLLCTLTQYAIILQHSSVCSLLHPNTMFCGLNTNCDGWYTIPFAWLRKGHKPG